MNCDKCVWVHPETCRECKMIKTLENMRDFGAWGHDHAKLLYELEEKQERLKCV